MNFVDEENVEEKWKKIKNKELKRSKENNASYTYPGRYIILKTRIPEEYQDSKTQTIYH